MVVRSQIIPCLLFFIIVCAGYYSCKEPEASVLQIAGVIIDGNTSEFINNVNVELSIRGISDGAFNNNFQTLESTSSDSNGAFNFAFENTGLAAVKLRIEKDNYFLKEIELSPEDIDAENCLLLDVEMFSVGQIEMRLVNASPISEDDNIEFRYTNASFDCSCCTNELKSFTGTDIDTTFTCFVPGNLNLEYLHIVTKSGNNILETGSVMIQPGMNTLTINY